MKEQTVNRSMHDAGPATEPNFDDERTLLAARPVVPLAKIDDKVRHRRYWLLGGAFALAMILGAASALLATYLNLRNVPDSATRITEVETQAEPVAVAPAVVADELSAVENTPSAENAEEPVVEVTTKRVPAARTRANESARPRVRETDEDEVERTREAVLFDAWQERRARRAARRERRNRVDNNDRDLSNLDEIFEGRRRP